MATFVELSTKAKMSIVCLAPGSKVKDPMKIDVDAGYHYIICAYVYQKNEVGKPSKRML